MMWRTASQPSQQTVVPFASRGRSIEAASSIGTVPILMYHSVDADCAPGYRPYAIYPDLFVRHMHALRDNGYETSSISQLVARRGDPAQVARLVGLTFDDGLRDFMTGAFPVLQESGLSATLYVVAGQVEQTSRWLRALGEGERPMVTWANLREIHGSGIECGAHSMSHPELDLLSDNAAALEIRDSKHVLEDGLGVAVDTFAYPHGYSCRRTRELVREAGFSSACRVRHALSSTTEDPLRLSRIIVTPNLEPHDLLALVRSGSLRVAPPSDTMPERAWRLVRALRRRL